MSVFNNAGFNNAGRMSPVAWVVALGVSVCAAQSPYGPDGEVVEPLPDMPRFELSEVRTRDTTLDKLIEFTYKRVKEGKGRVRLRARTDTGPISVPSMASQIQGSGVIKLKDVFARTRQITNPGSEIGIEFYFVATSDNPYNATRSEHLVSNSVVYGTMKTRVQPRAINEAENQASRMQELARHPPENLPPGYQRSSSDSKFAPGMPVQYGSLGQWKEGIVARDTGTSMVYLLVPNRERLRPVRRDRWLAIDKQVASIAKSDPASFSLDVGLMPKGLMVLRDGRLAVADLPLDSPLPPGTPLLDGSSSDWETVYFVEPDSSDRVKVLEADARNGRVRKKYIGELAIEASVWQQVQSGDTASFADRVASLLPERDSKPDAAASSMRSMDQSGTSDRSSSSGTLNSSGTPTSRTTRTWRDASGKFSLEAALIRQFDDRVRLRKTTGDEVEIPIAQLSSTDQQYLQSDANSSVNPFSPVATMGDSGGDGQSGIAPFSVPLKAWGRFGDLGWGTASLSISPDKQFLLVGRKGAEASLFDIRTGRVLIDSGRMNHLGNVTACGFSPSGQHVALCGDKGVVEIYQASDKGKLGLLHQFAPHSREIVSLAFSTDGQFALTGSDDDTAQYWEVATGRIVKTIDGFDGAVRGTRISPSGAALIACDGKTLKVHQIEQDKLIVDTKVGRNVHANDIAISRNATRMAIADGRDIQVWDLRKMEKLSTCEGDASSHSLALVNDGRYLLSGENGILRIWDTDTGSAVNASPIGESFYIKAVAVSHDGRLIAASSSHDEVTVLYRE